MMAGQVAVVWEGLLSGPETEIRGSRRSSSVPRPSRALLGGRPFVVRDLRRDTVLSRKCVEITGFFRGLSRETGFCGNCVGSTDFRKTIFGGKCIGISDLKGAFIGGRCVGMIDWPYQDESSRDAGKRWRRKSSLKWLSTEASSWEERPPAKAHLFGKKPVRGLSRGSLFVRNHAGLADRACGNDALGDAQKKWQRKSSLKGLSTEPSTSEDSSPPANSDSEGGAPMGNSSFVQKFLRLLSSFVQKLGSLWKGRGRRQFVLWSLLGCGLWMVYLSSSLGGNASPRLVPYSELVDHLEAKSVTNALFEEGSSNLYFNLRESEKDSVVVVKPEEQASTGKELTSSTSLAQEGSIEVPDLSAGITDEVTGDRAGPLNEVSKLSAEGSDDLTGNRGATLNPLNEGSGLNTGAISSQKASRKSGRWAFTTRRVKNDENFLLPLMREAGVRYSSAPQSMSAALKTVLITIITLWIPLSPLLWLLHRQMSQSSANGKKKRTISRLVKFEDVAGVDIARAELMEIVDCMRGATKFASLGAKVPKGVLLVGPPGTGKTLLARAVAGEAGIPFFATSASEFVEMFVGRGAARIRELFSEARKNAPSIVFIDELDAVGGRRGRSYNDERDQTLNQLLTEMDGFDSGESGVLVLAATNRPEALDPALCRPGRLSRRVHVTEPDLQGRQQVLAVHMRGVPVEDDPLLLQRLVASMTSGFVGADLANLVNEAALLAARKGRTAVVFADFKEAIDRVKYGVGDRQRNVFTEVEQRFGSWLNSLQKEAVYPTLGSSS